ncbi:hypothetical protein Pmar_PMAR001949 [Perkinsus marinus ATCC 50983]|uniref:Uncharacterized protein n=1 Tax=Perkinsus marinus (strain ATCC 50983 / TXsc) TaxID=423536 RepID=C5LXU3_PERM5|nr:hypothetical protein Pmar_PMAR001949 [Perkinsus marinus ATCC 50983]EEQ98450.1 hypothetical protein Pmar_PMAR001949 [Perkinsus marinus ATCC 50983]|eukprot:XP_002765733.1 hypothetical protein Pmar_PMAR001949 [Perkinsus marinus ATCC 50983]
MSGAAVFKRIPLAAKGVQVYQVSSATYRAGAALGMDLSVTKKPLNQALDAAIHKPQFLQVDTLKGIPVDTSLSQSSLVDPYLSRYIADLSGVYFDTPKK